MNGERRYKRGMSGERLWRGMSGELRREWVRNWHRVQRERRHRFRRGGSVGALRNLWDFNMDRPDMQLTSEILLAEALNSTKAEVLNVDAAVALLVDGAGDPCCRKGFFTKSIWWLPESPVGGFIPSVVMQRLIAMLAYAHSSDCDPLMSGFLIAMGDHVTERLQFGEGTWYDPAKVWRQDPAKVLKRFRDLLFPGCMSFNNSIMSLAWKFHRETQWERNADVPVRVVFPPKLCVRRGSLSGGSCLVSICAPFSRLSSHS